MENLINNLSNWNILCKNLFFKSKEEVTWKILKVLESKNFFTAKPTIFNFYLRYFWWFLNKYEKDFYDCFKNKEAWKKSKLEIKKSLCSLKQTLKLSKQENKITSMEYSFFVSFFNRTRKIFNKNVTFLVVDMFPFIFDDDLLYTYNRFENPDYFYTSSQQERERKIDFQRFMFKVFLLYEFYSEWNKGTFLRFKLNPTRFEEVVEKMQKIDNTKQLLKLYSDNLIKDYENKNIIVIEPFTYYVAYLKEIGRKFNYNDEDYNKLTEQFDLFYKKKITNYDLFETLYDILIKV